MELPPRARRIRPAWIPRRSLLGTTSACAENTQPGHAYMGEQWNYLRVRGEYEVKALLEQISKELPPRARRIRYPNNGGGYTKGTTSACAENTHGQKPPWRKIWNYLRVRGEYVLDWQYEATTTELPPRARRIPHPGARRCCPGGTTSACAENTRKTSSPRCGRWNYLRVRGEYHSGTHASESDTELPPRARRIRLAACKNSWKLGTTSACAENTHGHSMNPIPAWNYLRVRGEYIAPWRHRAMAVELPPRARRIP